MTRAEIYEKRQQYLFPCITHYYREPLILDRGEGCYVWDAEGNRYLDFYGGILTVSVGHCHPRIVEAQVEQARRLQHCSTLYITAPAVLLAEKLGQITPGALQKSFFTNSGTEANEMAILLAMVATGSQEVIALRHSYHGRSLMAMSLSGHAPWRLAGTHVAGLKHAVNPYCYRCSFGLEYPSCDVRCARDVEELIRTTTSGRVAAFIGEPIQGVGGFITPPPEYFAEVASIVRKYGGLFIADEVQTGFGRTGGKMFGIEHWGVEPDVMTCAKGLGNGVPIGATIATAEVADRLTGLTISTFGGNPVSTAAALATIETVEQEGLLQNCAAVGGYLRDRLLELKEKYCIIGDVRGMGLMQAIELVKENKQPAPDLVGGLFEESKKAGLLIGRGGLFHNVVRIAPPMTAGRGDVDEAARILDGALAVVSKQAGF